MRNLILCSIFCAGCFDYAGLSSSYDLDGAQVTGTDAADGDSAAVDLGALDAANGDQADPTQDLAPTCVQTLANVGAGDFTVRFTITTQATLESTVLYQRMQCSAVYDFWNVRMATTGKLIVELGQGNLGYASLTTASTVNNGLPHAVIVQRTSGVLSVSIDGAFSGSTPATYLLGALPPLGTTSGNPCEVGSGTRPVPLVGTIADVCLTIT